LEIVIVLAPLRKHGPNPSYTEDRTLSLAAPAPMVSFKLQRRRG